MRFGANGGFAQQKKKNILNKKDGVLTNGGFEKNNKKKLFQT